MRAVNAREIVFISHANPEDNEASRWLALQLVAAGYNVWCDIFAFRGGEQMWAVIENVIRHEAAKFVFVTTESSNGKEGTLKELEFATNVGKGIPDFVIPVRFGNIPHGDMSIHLAGKYTVDFVKSWAQGLNELLEKLEQHDVPKRRVDPRSSVLNWWSGLQEDELQVVQKPSRYSSNLFPFECPKGIWVHPTKSDLTYLDAAQARYPVYIENRYAFSFARWERLGLPGEVGQSWKVSVADFLKGTYKEYAVAAQARRIMTALFRQAWEKHLKGKGISSRPLSSDVPCFYYEQDQLMNDKVAFNDAFGRPASRQLIGYKTTTVKGESKIRYWHFGVDALPMFWPAQAFAVRGHIVFSDDGRNVWDSVTRLHRARRNQSKLWWNDKWRDLIQAFVASVAGGLGHLELLVSPSEHIKVDVQPMLFDTPVSFVEDIEAFDDELDEQVVNEEETDEDDYEDEG